MARGKMKRLAAAKGAAKAGPSQRATKAAKGTKEERRARKLEQRKKERKAITADQWNAPAPSHLVAKLDVPRIKSKYQSYFEFAENPEKKEKKLEFQVTNNATPPPGFVFVPIGDPMLTQACKELSREQDAMIFIVSNKGKEEGSKISEHIYRTGYHFREVIVDAAREIVGETIISKPYVPSGFIEPIPESQEEINKQADGAIRDLFPRIPNTDRQMIIEHAFKKGGTFHGEPTVGLQSEIPLSRRVQLAVLAHIRHTHTRYDKLLRETTWINARKVVEPVCLDILIKWRGDEETGRDQLEEILREVVVITDSEDEDDSSEEDSSDEEGEITSASSAEPPSRTNSRNQQRPEVQARNTPTTIAPSGADDRKQNDTISSRTPGNINPQSQKDKKTRGFKRYQAAWNEALHRRHELPPVSAPAYTSTPATMSSYPAAQAVGHSQGGYTNTPPNYPPNSTFQYGRENDVRYAPVSISTIRPEHRYLQPRSPMEPPMRGNEVKMRSQAEHPLYYSYTQPRANTPSYVVRETPSQVVRGSPVRHNPQDMPLPSIETLSNNLASPRADSHGDMRRNSNHPQESYPRRVEQPVRSPVQRQVIVIEDDSPQVKRRRVIREDESGHFRVDPISSHDHNFHVAAPLRSDSHFISTSPAEAGNFVVRHPRASSQSTQGLLRHKQPVFVDPSTSEEPPIIDGHSTGYIARHPTYARPTIGEHTSGFRRSSYGTQQPSHLYADNTRRPDLQPIAIQDSRALPYYESQPGVRYAPEPSQHHHDMGHNSEMVDRDLVHSFSQSRLHGSSSRSNNDFVVLSDRRHEQGSIHRGEPVQYFEVAAPTPYPSSTSTRARSSVRYMERPVEHRKQYRIPDAHHDVQYTQPSHPDNAFAPAQRQSPLPLGPPMYTYPPDPRRQIIVLE